MSIMSTLGWAAFKRIGGRLLIRAGATASVWGLKGIAVTALIGVFSSVAIGGYQQVRIWSRDAQIGRDAQRIGILEVSNAELEASVAVQNQAIEGLRITIVAAQENADKRVELAMQTNTERRRNAQRAGSGPVEMNRWMQEQFTSR